MKRIGVTGHRNFRNPDDVSAITAGVLDRILDGDDSPTILSSLAEGADRLVVDLVLARPDALLDVVLPLPADMYIADFVTPSSRQRFTDLLGRAASVMVVEQVPGEARELAYARAGRAIVDAVDVLVALWDGEPARGPGGTAEIVQYAMNRDVLVEMILVERAR